MTARKTEAADTVTYLDLSGDVSDADYQRVLRSLLDQFETWRLRQCWCTEFYYYVDQLSNTLRWNSSAEQMEIVVPSGFSNTERAADLRDIRGRILRFTIDQARVLSLDKANDFLTGAGLAPYQPAVVPERRFDASIGAYPISTTLTGSELRDKIRGALDAEFGHGVWQVDINERRSGSQVPESETVRLLARAR